MLSTQSPGYDMLISSVESSVKECIKNIFNGAWTRRFILSDGGGYMCKVISESFENHKKLMVLQGTSYTDMSLRHHLIRYCKTTGWDVILTDNDVFVTASNENIQLPNFEYLTRIFGENVALWEHKKDNMYKLKLNESIPKNESYSPFTTSSSICTSVSSSSPLNIHESSTMNKMIFSMVTSCIHDVLCKDDAWVPCFILSGGSGLICKRIIDGFEYRKRCLQENVFFSGSWPYDFTPVTNTKPEFILAHLLDSVKLNYDGWKMGYLGSTLYMKAPNQEKVAPTFNHLNQIFQHPPDTSCVMWTSQHTLGGENLFCLHEDWAEYYVNIFGYYGYHCNHMFNGCTRSGRSKPGKYKSLRECEDVCTVMPDKIISECVKPFMTNCDWKKLRSTSKCLFDLDPYIQDNEGQTRIEEMFHAVTDHWTYEDHIASNCVLSDEDIKRDLMTWIVLANDYYVHERSKLIVNCTTLTEKIKLMPKTPARQRAIQNREWIINKINSRGTIVYEGMWFEHGNENFNTPITIENTEEVPLLIECVILLNSTCVSDLPIAAGFSVCLHSIIEEMFMDTDEIGVKINIGTFSETSTEPVPDWAIGYNARIRMIDKKRRRYDDDD